MSTRARYARSMAIAGLVSLVAAACSSAEGENQAAGPHSSGCLDAGAQVPVSVGIRSSLVFSDIYLAHERGYFEDAGLDVTLEAVDPATALQLVSAGDVDAVATGLTAGLFNAIDAGLGLYPVSSGGNDGEQTGSQFWVRTDLVESGEVDDISDLAGRRFAMPGMIGAGASQKVALYLQQGDLSLTDVELVNIDYPDMPAAFANGSIDAAYVTAGGSGPIEAADSARPLGDQQITVDVNTNTVVFGARLAEEEAALGTAFLRAMMRARGDLQGSYWEDPAVVTDLQAATDIDAQTIEQTARAAFAPELDFTPESWEAVQEVYSDAGVLEYSEVKDFEEVAAPNLRETAVKSRAECG